MIPFLRSFFPGIYSLLNTWMLSFYWLTITTPAKNEGVFHVNYMHMRVKWDMSYAYNVNNGLMGWSMSQCIWSWFIFHAQISACFDVARQFHESDASFSLLRSALVSAQLWWISAIVAILPSSARVFCHHGTLCETLNKLHPPFPWWETSGQSNQSPQIQCAEEHLIYSPLGISLSRKSESHLYSICVHLQNNIVFEYSDRHTAVRVIYKRCDNCLQSYRMNCSWARRLNENMGDDERQDLKHSKKSLPSLVSSAALSVSICLCWHGTNHVYRPYSETVSPWISYEH